MHLNRSTAWRTLLQAISSCKLRYKLEAKGCRKETDVYDVCSFVTIENLATRFYLLCLVDYRIAVFTFQRVVVENKRAQ